MTPGLLTGKSEKKNRDLSSGLAYTNADRYQRHSSVNSVLYGLNSTPTLIHLAYVTDDQDLFTVLLESITNRSPKVLATYIHGQKMFDAENPPLKIY